MQPEQRIDYDGQLAQAYDAGRRIGEQARTTWRAAVDPWLSPHHVVADVGAGSGRFAPLLAEVVGSVIAVEPAAGMRSAAHHSGAASSAVWVGASAEQLPLAPGSIDAIWSAFTTHYFDLPAAAAEFARVLRPSGRVLIWHCFPEVFDQLEWFRWFPSARAIDEERMPSQRHVVAEFERVGFTAREQSIHQKLVEPNPVAFAERMSHRSISTMRLIDDEEFADGIARLRAHAAAAPPQPVYAPNVLLVLEAPQQSPRTSHHSDRRSSSTDRGSADRSGDRYAC